MSKRYLLPALSGLTLTLVGCAATPENPQLLEARQAYAALQGKPESHRMAALETRQAQAALDKAEQASLGNRKSPEVGQLAYLAHRSIEAAEQTIVLRQAEAGMRGIEARRTQARLDVRTAQLNALKALKGQPSERGTVVTFGDVLFDTGRAELRAGNHADIQRLAQFLLDNPERKVRIEGFTDATGGESLNQRLSEQRAAAVANALHRQGVAPERIVSVGYGKAYPVASNAHAQSRQLNRRVEVVVSHDARPVATRH
ncbi:MULTISPECIES: OmpA family protein [unclassified Pseudomonas]|uniref:OmpA family protein n=1 Tax=unclassified Pseudomonas TaxID=196821 RepID=UPI00244CAF18|nr:MULTISPECIES: OmpA family protein [unclassified Pseudomonas]MDH0304298.1 OmpA family protein [Pseudomonas sp. GD04091]MDH1983299.1 OmpA family protein [Pseudomonas sp. GD03689]